MRKNMSNSGEPIADQQEIDERTCDFRAAIAELVALGIAELARMGVCADADSSHAPGLR